MGTITVAAMVFSAVSIDASKTSPFPVSPCSPSASLPRYWNWRACMEHDRTRLPFHEVDSPFLPSTTRVYRRLVARVVVTLALVPANRGIGTGRQQNGREPLPCARLYYHFSKYRDYCTNLLADESLRKVNTLPHDSPTLLEYTARSTIERQFSTCTCI